MEAFSRKAEIEKVAELDAMLADATLTGDVTDSSSISFESDAPTPTKHRHSLPPETRHGPTQSPRRTWHSSNPNRTINSSVDNSRCAQHSFSAVGGVADITARIYSTSSSHDSSGAEELEKVEEQSAKRARRHGLRRRRVRGRDDGMTAKLGSQLAVARSQLEQKEVVTRSLQRQLDQREEIDRQTQARAEEGRMAALAKASGLQEELARTSQLLMDGARARQELEQRCSLLTRDLQKSTARTAELESQAAATHAELVRVSGALHARRGTDVVDAERAFGEELQRVQESAVREARAMKLEASGLRASLDEMATKFRKACADRDSWRDEAEAIASEVNSLREIVSALRQYSKDDTIDQLLGQVSRWKRRAEELERLQRVSSPDGTATFGSVSDTEASTPAASAGRASPGADRGASEVQPLDPAAEEVAASVTNQEDDRAAKEILDAKFKSIQLEVLETREALSMAGEEAMTAVTALRDETRKRIEAQAREESLQKELEASARAARENMLARRAAKARDMANIKKAIQQEMEVELRRLRLELEAERQAEKAHDVEESPARAPVGVDKSCQVEEFVASTKGKAVSKQHSPAPTDASSASGIDSGGSTTDAVTFATSTAVMTEGGDQRRAVEAIAAADSARVVAEAAAVVWAQALSAVTRLIHTALASLCEHVSDALSAEHDELHRLTVPLSSVEDLFGIDELHSQGTNDVIPWACKEAKPRSMMALRALGQYVDSGAEQIRRAVAERAVRTVIPPSPIVASVGSQTENIAVQVKAYTEEGHEGYAPRQGTSVGVQVDRPVVGDDRVGEGSPGEHGGAPAWEGRKALHKHKGHSDSQDDQHRQRQAMEIEHAAAVVQNLRREADALGKALTHAEDEKRSLKRSLTRRFEREKAAQLKQQRDLYESQIRDLHECTMAVVHEFGTLGAA